MIIYGIFTNLAAAAWPVISASCYPLNKQKFVFAILCPLQCCVSCLRKVVQDNFIHVHTIFLKESQGLPKNIILLTERWGLSAIRIQFDLKLPQLFFITNNHFYHQTLSSICLQLHLVGQVGQCTELLFVFFLSQPLLF